MSVPAESLDIRMARLEGAYEQINERLSELRGDVHSVRGEISVLGEKLRAEMVAGDAALRSEISALGVGLRADLTAGHTALRSEMGEMRRQMSAQFYWTLTLILGSILIPLLRELAR